ncbi:efflux RND transporter permease subunit [Pleurocapsa sp. FMAR1]|uniref:efflux RND transporter permease subunit n=1 Tax=Pleurocapsa sp. FMAR1 TaxID=3040204 RepID=UPI0029C7ECFC|nr:efflux RND transporter permease subunit [Pleurocapsa sp. FMAR1]
MSQIKPSNNDHHSEPQPKIAKASPFARFFFLRTVFGILLTILLVVGGLLAYGSMIKESNPDINIATASVTTTWGGADPETIEQEVTNELEKEIKSVEGVKTLKSASYSGYSLINVEFNSNADVNRSIQLLRDAVSKAESEIPREAEQPVVQQVSVNDAPILTVALFGDLDLAVLNQSAERLQDRLEGVPGVTEVTLGGSRDRVVQIQLNPSRLASLGISPTTVASRLRTANRDAPLDEIESSTIGTQVRFYGRFRSLKELQQLPISRLDGRVIRLSEIAEIRQELEQEDTRAFISWQGEDYKPVVSVAVKKVPGQDSIKVIENVKAEIEAAKTDSNDWAYGMEYEVIADDSEIIWEQLGSLFVNSLQAMVAVFVILFIALSWREALIAGLSIPLTFLGTLAVLWLLGQTLNNMVLIGMVLALGILVDVFILMMEGMHEAIFVSGLPFNQAALKTVRTYAAPAFAGQLTTILAMTPLMAIGGTMGKFIRVLPITAVVCLILSFVIALLVDIPLSRFLLANVKGNHQPSRIDRLSETASKKFARWSLNYTVCNKATARAWSLGAVALFICAIFAFTQIPTTFFPEQDGRKLSVNVEMPPTTTLVKSQEIADELGSILQEKNYFTSVTKYVGQRSNLVSSGELQPNQGSYLLGFSVVFTPEDERERLSYEYLDEIRNDLTPTLANYPGASLVLNSESSTGSGEPIQIEITGNDIGELRNISDSVQQALRQIPGTSDVRDNLGDLQPDLKLIPKREALDFYGITEEELTSQARYYMTATDVGDFDLGGNEEDLEIRLSTAWKSRNGAVGSPTQREELRLIRFFNNDGEVIPAGSLVSTVPDQAPLSITHRGGKRTVTVLSKNVNRTVGEILADLEPELKQMQQNWSSGYDYSFGGETAEQAETFGSAGQALGLAIFLVFAVLVLQLGSFRQPFIILLAIPLALIGTMGGFFLAWIPFSFSAFIGIIALVGIVVNDAIVMVDTMNTYQSEGMKVREAAAFGVSDRLRPILTTSVTTIIGLIPLALSDPSWMPLCSAIIFGLMAATLTALVVIPCLYLQFTPKTEINDAEIA